MGTIEKKGVKLYDVPRDSKVKILGDIKVPMGAFQLKEGDVIDFKHIDGMYSLCYKDKVMCHLAAWAEVEIVKI